MSNWPYTEKELTQYFSDPARRRPGGTGTGGFSGFFRRRFPDPRKARAAQALAVLASVLLIGVLGLVLFMATLLNELPSLEQLENPNFQLASIAYTADGQELARYARQNRAWVTFEEISPHVINALVATEDHRFYEHWGIDLFRTLSGVGQTILSKLHVPGFQQQGGSTLTQQLARNLYNEQIGRQVTIGRKLKEMVTAVELERRYTKREIIEMYLNTVEFGYNAFGIEAAARTFFGKDPMELDEMESATLVGMLKGTTLYNPVTRPENARNRRNVVLNQMVQRGHLSDDFYQAHKADSVRASYHSVSITNSVAPHFAQYVGDWVKDWAQRQGYALDLYTDGLVIYTTLDSRFQTLAQAAVTEQMECLQAVVDFEWSRPVDAVYSTEACDYRKLKGYKPFDYLWSSQKGLVDQFIREGSRYASLRRKGISREEVVARLRQDPAFMDSLRANKTRLEGGLVSIDPRTGHVKAWVGGRKMEEDWNDHVAGTTRQPGSTFKPFVYTAAIYNGWSPYDTFVDTSFTYVDVVGNEWSPKNTGGTTGLPMTLREGLARSKNTITGQLMLQVGPAQVAFFARRMGIKSELDEVMALALGTSDVTLLEMTSAYSTLANGGLYQEPVVVTRIEDHNGNILYEAEPAPREALSEEVAYTMVDMLRGVIDEGTGIRIHTVFGLSDYDLAGKTGTTQNSADGWFMMMHPDLVTGAWVGFNDRRLAFRSDFWGQGAHNALYLVGDYFKRVVEAGEPLIDPEARFPLPEDYGRSLTDPLDPTRPRHDRGRVSW